MTISRNDAAALLCVSRETIDSWVEGGVLPTVYVHGKLCIDANAFHTMYGHLQEIRKHVAILDKYEDNVRKLKEYWKTEYLEWERDVRIASRINEARAIRKLIHAVIQMVGYTSNLSVSTIEVVRSVVEGDNFEQIAKSYGMSRDEVRRKVLKFIDEARWYVKVAETEENNNQLKEENLRLKRKIDALKSELKDRNIQHISKSFSLNKDEEACLDVLTTDFCLVNLGLSKTIEDKLNANGYHTIADLIAAKEDDFASIPGLGKTKVKQIKTALFDFLASMDISLEDFANMYINLCKRIMVNNELNTTENHARKQ